MTEAAVFTNERRAGTPNGHVFVREIPGEDPSIILMHGFPDDHRIYDKLLHRCCPQGGLVDLRLARVRALRSNRYTTGFVLETTTGPN